MLKVEGLETAYGRSQVLFGVDLEVEQGALVSLMGRNGMGKSTTIRSILGLTRARSGKIFFEQQEVSQWPAFQISRLGLGLVPEGRQVFPLLTVEENLIATSANRFGQPHPWTLEGIFTLFPRLAERRNQMGSALSGGEQQMLAIGRALMTNPKLLILDEATEGLAPLIREEIWSVLELLKQRGQSTLVIDKNLDRLLKIADYHFVMERGRVVWSGNRQNLTANSVQVLQYLGV
jgi:branched-chain amino acid transport system ATP-binding protein